METARTIDALPVLSPVLAAYLVAILIPAVRRRARLAGPRLVKVTLLVGYALFVVGITMFPIRVHGPEYWSAPWWSVLRPVPFDVDLASFVLNVIMLVPFGVLVPLLWPVLGSTARIAAAAAGTSLGIETSQFVLGAVLGSRRTVDVNDLIANTAGALVGLLLLRLLAPYAGRRTPTEA